MARDRSYLDHNATSPLRPEARAAMLEAMDLVGNPSSVHAEGRAAKAMLERARRQVASLVGAKPEQVIFTSGGTEALGMALAAHDGPIMTSAIEHDALRSPVAARPGSSAEAPASDDGIVALAAFEKVTAASDAARPILLALQAANNETGVEQPIKPLARHAAAASCASLTDAVQVAGKRPLDIHDIGVDHLALSAHKLGGPKGVGAFVSVAEIPSGSVFRGGGQERGLRAGTENLVGIAAFGAAAEAAQRDLDAFASLAAWRDELERAVMQQTPDAVIIGQSAPRLPNTSCIALPGIPAETLVMALDLEGVAVSAGSACSSGKVTRSHVLEAMGLPDEICRSAIRVSLGWNSSKKDVERFVTAWRAVTNRLMRR
ncbi:MAG: cysteine desulfurase family protein [Pseudomonadota bacterium]